jgi:mRNA-degrading endonuclease toxin of MazEF toxin-antitoxin module
MRIKQWDIWYAEWAHLDTPNEAKPRPVLIRSKNNKETVNVLALKITTKTNYYGQNEYIDIWEWEKAGLTEPSYIILIEIQSIPINSFLYKIGELTVNDILRLGYKMLP